MGAGALLLLAIAIVRLAVPDRSRLRPLSVEAVWIRSRAVPAGETIVGEEQWTPPADVYVVGWNPWLGMPANVGFEAKVMLYTAEAKTTLFVAGLQGFPPGTVDTWRPFALPQGTGYRCERGQPLTFRYEVTNRGGAAFETRGAGVILYFVPVQGN